MQFYNTKDFFLHLKDILTNVVNSKEGFIIVRHNRPIARLTGITIAEGKELLKQMKGKVASVSPYTEGKKIQIDTFTTIETIREEHMMGICSRCGTKGEVIKKMHLGPHGYTGAYLCLAKCWKNTPKHKDGPGKLIKVNPKEMTHNQATHQSDFGAANE